MSKFTPGPWVITDIDNLPDGGKWIDISDGAYAIPIVSVRGKDHDANAALIAAAPDMYEALKGLLAKVECGTALECELCDAARNALKKAQGKS